jgi:CheY-like chemotaxis protein
MARVLIVDPEPDLRLLAAEAVTELGHEAVMLEEPITPTAADVLMIAPCEEMRGLVQRLRAVSPGLSVILVSVAAPGQDTRALAPAGYLAKPYTLEALARALDRALAAREAAA